MSTTAALGNGRGWLSWANIRELPALPCIHDGNPEHHTAEKRHHSVEPRRPRDEGGEIAGHRISKVSTGVETRIGKNQCWSQLHWYTTWA